MQKVAYFYVRIQLKPKFSDFSFKSKLMHNSWGESCITVEVRNLVNNLQNTQGKKKHAVLPETSQQKVKKPEYVSKGIDEADTLIIRCQ